LTTMSDPGMFGSSGVMIADSFKGLSPEGQEVALYVLIAIVTVQFIVFVLILWDLFRKKR